MKTLNFKNIALSLYFFLKHRFIASETLPVEYSRGLFLFILNAAEINKRSQGNSHNTLFKVVI